MKKYKKSRFMLECEDRLINYKNGDIIYFNNDNDYKSCINSLIDDGSPAFKKLLDKEFLIPDYLDEPALMQYYANKELYGNEMLELTIIPTNACNFHCIYCYELQRTEYMSDKTFDNVFKFLEKNIKKYDILNIDWFGGEPLLAKDKIISFMGKVKELCRTNKTILISNMTTNGYLLDVQTINALVNNMILYYQVTIDGLASTHDVQRCLHSGDGTFDIIIKNLKDIRDGVDSKRLRILIRTNVTQEMIPEFHKYLEFIKEEFGNDPRFLFHITEVKDWGGERVEKIKDSFIDIDENASLTKKLQEMDLVTPSVYHNFSKGSICSAARMNGFIIDYDGSLKKCTIAMESDDPYLKEINCVGLIDDRGNMHLNEALQSIWVQHYDLTHSECADCLLYPRCYGTGCVFKRLQDRMQNKESECKWKKEFNLKSI